MTDPFSVIVGTISLVGAALKTSKVTRDFIVGIKGAPRSIETLSNDVDGLYRVLDTLQDLLREKDRHQNAALISLAPKLEVPLNNCMQVLDELNNALRPYVKSIKGEGGSKWRASSLWRFKEKDIVSLQRNVMNSQSVLDSAVQVVHLSISSKEFSSIKTLIKQNAGYDTETKVDSDFEGSEAPRTDYGFAMKRFMLESASVAYEPPPASMFSDDDDDDDDEAEESSNKAKEVHLPSLYVLPRDSTPPRILPTTRYGLKKDSPSLRTPPSTPLSQTLRRNPPPLRTILPTWSSLTTTMGTKPTILRKTIVSPTALQNCGYEYQDDPEDSSRVLLSQHLDAQQVKQLRDMSTRLGGNPRNWWTKGSNAVAEDKKYSAPQNVEKPKSTNVFSGGFFRSKPTQNPIPEGFRNEMHVADSGSSKYPSQPSDSNDTQLIRKTIVSRTAMIESGIAFRDISKYIVTSKLDPNTLSHLRERSTQIQPNRNLWWNEHDYPLLSSLPKPSKSEPSSSWSFGLKGVNPWAN